MNIIELNLRATLPLICSFLNSRAKRKMRLLSKYLRDNVTLDKLVTLRTRDWEKITCDSIFLKIDEPYCHLLNDLIIDYEKRKPLPHVKLLRIAIGDINLLFENKPGKKRLGNIIQYYFPNLEELQITKAKIRTHLLHFELFFSILSPIKCTIFPTFKLSIFGTSQDRIKAPEIKFSSGHIFKELRFNIIGKTCTFIEIDHKKSNLRWNGIYYQKVRTLSHTCDVIKNLHQKINNEETKWNMFE